MALNKQTKAATKKTTTRTFRKNEETDAVTSAEEPLAPDTTEEVVPATVYPDQRYIDLLSTESITAVWEHYLDDKQNDPSAEQLDSETRKYLFVKNVIRALFARCPVVTYIDHIGATTCRYFDGVLFAVHADPAYCALKNDTVTYFLVAKKDSQFERFTYENIHDGSYVALTFEDDSVSMGFLSRIVADLVRTIGWKLAWVSPETHLEIMDTYDVETDPVAHRIIDILYSQSRKEGHQVALRWSSPVWDIQDGVFVPKDTTPVAVTTPVVMPVDTDGAPILVVYASKRDLRNKDPWFTLRPSDTRQTTVPTFSAQDSHVTLSFDHGDLEYSFCVVDAQSTRSLQVCIDQYKDAYLTQDTVITSGDLTTRITTKRDIADLEKSLSVFMTLLTHYNDVDDASVYYKSVIRTVRVRNEYGRTGWVCTPATPFIQYKPLILSVPSPLHTYAIRSCQYLQEGLRMLPDAVFNTCFDVRPQGPGESDIDCTGKSPRALFTQFVSPSVEAYATLFYIPDDQQETTAVETEHPAVIVSPEDDTSPIPQDTVDDTVTVEEEPTGTDTDADTDQMTVMEQMESLAHKVWTEWYGPEAAADGRSTDREMPAAVRALYRKVLPQESIDVMCAHYRTLGEDMKDTLDTYLTTLVQGMRMQQKITAVFSNTKHTRKTDCE